MLKPLLATIRDMFANRHRILVLMLIIEMMGWTLRINVERFSVFTQSTQLAGVVLMRLECGSMAKFPVDVKEEMSGKV